MLSLGISGGPDSRSERVVVGVDYAPSGGEAALGVARHAVAAVAAVAGRVSMVFAAARVTGRLAAQALEPHVLERIGADLVRRSDSLHVLRMRAGRPTLLPAGPYWDVRGGANRRDWVYDATIPGASSSDRVVLPRRSVLHVLRDPDPWQPERGVSLLRSAALTARLAVLAESALGQEMRQPSKSLIPMPMGMEDAKLRDLQAQLAKLDRPVGLPPTLRAGAGSGMAAAPATDWKPQRLRPDPASGLVDVAGQVQARIAAALGVHPALVGGGAGNGSIDREAWRQLMDLLVLPLARLVEAAAGELFGEEVRLRWPVRDDAMLIRARTAAQLTGIGVPLDEARTIARLDE